MRRLLSILLLAAFALPLVAPLLALAQDPDAGLPACCRRHGQHHCTMFDRDRDSSAHRVVAICPAWPQHAIPSPVGAHHYVGCESSVAVCHPAGVYVVTPAPGCRLTAREGLHPKRGPPTIFLA
jgi:hypothetical protein